ENNFFGTSVTVSGLITGRDIIDQFPKNSDYNCIFLPPNCINDNGLLLDDVTPDEIAEAIGVPVKVGFYDMEEMVNQFEE
ncbi:MAG: Fe-S oxidoreductase, partial [Candidatus Neomarinimicrobiota bacterium]